MYYYKIYGLIVKSNIEIDLAENINKKDYSDLEIFLSYDTVDDGNKIKLSKNQDKYTLYIPHVAKYLIEKDYIYCSASSYNSFISTLFNIPFSILCILRGELLLHACSLISEKGLILLCGKKGVGKSTLSVLLDSRNLHLFSDDTIRLDKNLQGYSAHNYLKLDIKTINQLRLTHSNKTNIVNKYYVKFDHQNSSAPLYKIFLLNRSNRTYIQKLEPYINVLKKNIVGIEFFDSTLLAKTLGLKDKTDSAYMLYINSNFDDYVLERDLLVNIILKRSDSYEN